MLNFLTRNKIMDMAGLDEKFKSMIEEQMNIRDELKSIERRLATLTEHIKQSDIYLEYKGKKVLTDSEQILFTAANNYLKGVMNGKTTLPTKAWKAEYSKLTTERNRLNQRYVSLKNEVKEAEQIYKSVYSILRQEQRERQPGRLQLLIFSNNCRRNRKKSPNIDSGSCPALSALFDNATDSLIA